MRALRGLVNMLVAVVSFALVCAGVLGLAVLYYPETTAVLKAREVFVALLERVLPMLPFGGDAEEITAWLSAFPWRYLVAPAGLAGLLWTRSSQDKRAQNVREDDGGPRKETREDRRGRKKGRAEAARIARRGMPAEAAELCLAVGELDEAAEFFIKAGQHERAAEIRHDQNRFVESAELYAKAGRHDSAGAIYAQQEKWDLAAEAYVESGNLSVAAEMYEKAGNDRRAGQCYQKCEFPRYAAKAYIRCEEWLLAAECLEQVLIEESHGSIGDAQKHAERMKLVRMTGNLFERSGRMDRALDVLAKGGAFVPAAEIALKAGKQERAAELFLEGRDTVRAAKAFEAVGQVERAARILADHHRDRGNPDEAAQQFERAGEWMEAGDLYRSTERFDKAGECYERFGDSAQAAEMFALAGDRERAAENYQRAGRFAEAAELFALAGDSSREADLLEKAGQSLRAGRIHLEAGRTEEAISALQKVGVEHADFASAAALLGGIFRDRQQYPLAIAKLREAIANREIDRQNIDAFFCLATVHEANEDWQEANDLYEKILAFDYNHGDAPARLEKVRAQLAAAPAPWL